MRTTAGLPGTHQSITGFCVGPLSGPAWATLVGSSPSGLEAAALSALSSWSVLAPELQTAEPPRAVFCQVLDPQSSPLKQGNGLGRSEQQMLTTAVCGGSLTLSWVRDKHARSAGQPLAVCALSPPTLYCSRNSGNSPEYDGSQEVHLMDTDSQAMEK